MFLSKFSNRYISLKSFVSLMRVINPKDYDYLWTDYEVNYIFISCYLFNEFKAAEIVEVDAEKGIVRKII